MAPLSMGDAAQWLEAGDVDALREALRRDPQLATSRDADQATLLLRLIDWPGHRPRAAETARLLLEAGADTEARRAPAQGTALAGTLCTEDVEVMRVLVEFGADIHAPLGWESGTILDLADRMCQELNRRGDPKVQAIAKLFSQAAGHKLPRRTPLGGVVPLLFVQDVDEGLKFYLDKLGFRVQWSTDASACGKYVSIARGNVEFHITVCMCEDKGHTGKLWVRVECDPVDPLFEEFKAAGVTIRHEPENQDYGLREFEIEDPDGNRLTFAGPIREEHTGVG